MTGVVAPPQHQDLLRYYEEAVKILEESPSIREVVPEDKFDAFVTKIERELKVHRPS